MATKLTSFQNVSKVAQLLSSHLFFVFLGEFCHAVSVGMGFVITPLSLQEAAFSKTLIAMLLSFEMIATFIVAPFFSSLVSKIGFKHLIIGGLILRNIAIALLPFSSDPIYKGALIFLSGFGGMCYFISVQIWVSRSVRDEVKSRVMAGLGTIMSIGIATGPLIVSLIGSKGFLPFLLSGAICMLGYYPLKRCFYSLPVYQSEEKIRLWRILNYAPYAILSGMLADAMFVILSSFIVIYATHQGVPETEAAFLISIMLCSGIIVQIPTGWLADRLNKYSFILGLTVLGIVCSQFLPIAVHISWFTWVVFGAWSISISGLYNSSLGLLATHFRGADFVSANAAFALMNCVSGIMAVLFAGRMIDWFGIKGLPIAITSYLGIGFALFLVLLQRKKL